MTRISRVLLLAGLLGAASVTPVFAALESDVEFSTQPEVEVSFTDATGSVYRPACTQEGTDPLLVYDQRGNVVTLVYMPTDDGDC